MFERKGRGARRARRPLRGWGWGRGALGFSREPPAQLLNLLELLEGVTLWELHWMTRDPLVGGRNLLHLVVSPQRLGLLLWHGFDPWPGNFHMLQVQLNKTKQTK